MTSTAVRLVRALECTMLTAQREVEKHQMAEAARTGTTPGWQRAADEWLETRFPDWKAVQWQRAMQRAVATPAALGWARPRRPRETHR